MRMNELIYDSSCTEDATVTQFNEKMQTITKIRYSSRNFCYTLTLIYCKLNIIYSFLNFEASAEEILVGIRVLRTILHSFNENQQSIRHKFSKLIFFYDKFKNS